MVPTCCAMLPSYSPVPTNSHVMPGSQRPPNPDELHLLTRTPSTAVTLLPFDNVEHECATCTQKPPSRTVGLVGRGEETVLWHSCRPW